MSCTWINPIALPFAVLLMMLYRLFQGPADNQSTFAYALALLLIAVIVRVVLLPFQMKSKRGMLKQTRLQPKLNELQKRHGANKQKYNEEMAKLYKEEGVNPASGCLWSFIQMPIMLALFYAIRQPLSLMMGLSRELWEKGGIIYERLIELFMNGALSETGGLSVELHNYLGDDTALWSQKLTELASLEDLGFYSELYAAHEISDHWEVFKNLGIEGLSRISFYLGNVNLAEVPNWKVWEFGWTEGTWLPALILFSLPILSGASQFLSMHVNRKTMPQPTPQQGQPGGANTVMKFMPLMSVWFGFILPGALSIYWTIGTGLQIVQDIWLTKRYTRILDEEDAASAELRKKKEAEIEAKRLETERLKAEGLLAENRNTSKRKKQKSEKQEQRERAAEWEKKNAPAAGKKEDKDEPGRVDNRRYARGRAYDPDRYAPGNADNDNDPDDNTSTDTTDDLDDNTEV